jgi:hypothetical protein
MSVRVVVVDMIMICCSGSDRTASIEWLQIGLIIEAKLSSLLSDFMSPGAVLFVLLRYLD